MEHWHIDRKTDEDAEMAFTTIYAALDAIESDVRDRADYHFQGISANGDARLFQGAYESFKEWQTYDNVAASLENVRRQHSLPTYSTERAPLYRSDANHTVDEVTDKLDQTAQYVAHMVNSETVFSIWHCVQDDVLQVTDDNTDMNGELAADWPEDKLPIY